MLPSFGLEFCSDMCLRRGLVHPRINVITNSQLIGLEGEAGDFSATIKKRARLVAPEKCIACGLCVDVCPVEVKGDFNSGLSKRKAIFMDYPSAAPKTYTIDHENCTKCEECVKICPTKAVDLKKEDEEEKLGVGAVILALGFTPYNPAEMSELRYDEYEDVVTALEFERLVSGTGPRSDRVLKRSSDGDVPGKIAFLQCIGSRDEDHNFCSFACCMHSLKEAMMAKELNPDLDVTIFYMDMRTFGKGYQRYYDEAKKMDIRFIRSRVASIQKNEEGKLIVNVVDESDTPLGKPFDLVVLATGQMPPKSTQVLSKVLDVKLNDHGFISTEKENPTLTSREGVFAVGSISGPKDVPDTITEASCAAAWAGLLIGKKNLEELSKENIEDMDEDAMELFICGADSCLGGSLDLKDITEYAATLKNVKNVKQAEFLCLDMDNMKEQVVEDKAGKVIIAACSPYPFEDKFLSTLGQVGIDPSQIEMVNLREGCAWVHEDKAKATKKAKDLIAMAREKLALSETISQRSMHSISSAMVIGGGIAGLTGALRIAESGYDVDLVEKESELGGNAKEVFYTLDDMDVQNYLKNAIERVNNHKNITVYLNSEVLDVKGAAGKFLAKIQAHEEELNNMYGAVILATGAQPIVPSEYLFGDNEGVITQRDLEKQIHTGKFSAKNVVMIQCANLRDEYRKYCGRICCSQALKNAMSIKELDPKSQVHILYQDMMTYGFSEEYYIKAKEMGVNFIRYDPTDKPRLSLEEDILSVEIKEPVLSETLSISPDLVVLSVGPSSQGNDEIGNIFEADLKLDEDGFFSEANVKFRPVDFVSEGIYVCGLAHSPRSIPESIVQAEAAAGKAMTILSKSSLFPRQSISEVYDRWCVGCESCVVACPYEARKIASEKKVAEVAEPLCKGCGVCAVVCPSGAAKLRSYREKQILAMIDEAVS
jgi:heterodisulfide reductase subunit A